MGAPPAFVLHGSMTPNVTKVVTMLEECGLSYDIAIVDIVGGEQFGAAFTALNPNAKVPVLVERASSLAIAESVTILTYLAETSGRFWPTTPADRAVVLQWLLFQATGLGPALGQLRHFLAFAPPSCDYARDRFGSEAARLLQVFEERLASCPFVAGGDYGLADINLFPWIHDTLQYQASGLDFGISPNRHPALVAWHGKVAARPPVVAALARMKPVEAHTRARIGEATPNDFDRLFRRGRHQRR